MARFEVLSAGTRERPHGHILRVIVLLAAFTALSGAAPALAAVTSTSISSPADHSYLTWHAIGDTSATVNGTAPGASNGDKSTSTATTRTAPEPSATCSSPRV